MPEVPQQTQPSHVDIDSQMDRARAQWDRMPVRPRHRRESGMAAVMARTLTRRRIVILAGVAVFAALSVGFGITVRHNSSTTISGTTDNTAQNPQVRTLAGKVNAWMASRINEGTFAGDGIVPGDGVVCGQSGLGSMFVSCTIMDQNGSTIRTALVTVYNPSDWAHSPINVSFTQN